MNLTANVYPYFDARCRSQGDVIDRWAALHQRDVRGAAIELVQTFGLEPYPAKGAREEERLADRLAR